jgi:hypothetical protein
VYMPSLIEINDSGDDQVVLCCSILKTSLDSSFTVFVLLF